MELSNMANVFISHRGSDAELAERLAIDLRNAGHQVWFDQWNIGLGDSIVARINEGLVGASYVVVCSSSSGLISPWMGREWMSALARQLNGAGVKLLPALLTGGQVPAILADIKYADLGRDWVEGLRALLNAMK